MIAAVSHDVLSQEKSYSILSKVECVFAAIWHNPEGLIRTEDVAKYYEVSPDEVSDILKSHWDEFSEEVTAGWTPRAAIRLGMILNSATATKVRSLALDVIEAYNNPTKRAAVAFLLKSGDFVQWSDREIAKILECSPTVVGEVRKKLEADNKILPFERRKHNRDGKTVERKTRVSARSCPPGGHEQPSKPDSTVTPPQPKVKVSSPSHPRFGQEGIVTGDPDNKTHLFVAFPDCPSELVAIADLDGESVEYPLGEEGNNPSPVLAPSPRTYTEEELGKEINRAIAEAKLGFKVEMEELALSQVKEQLLASRSVAEKVKAENIKLQQQLEQMESLRLLEIENKYLQERNQELEKALAEKPIERWNITPSATKVLNKNVEKALKNTIDLQSLAQSAPSSDEDAERCLELMGLALGNLAKSMKNTQAMSAAAILLGCAPTQSAIALTIERTQMVAQAVADIRKVISTGCDFKTFFKVASEYDAIKNAYWAELTDSEKDFIRTIKATHDAGLATGSEIPSLSPIQVGAIVSSSNINSQLYIKQGVVTEEINPEEVYVLWNHDSEAKPKRFFKEELRIAEKELQVV